MTGVKECQEIVYKPIILASCPVKSEIRNVRIEGHARGGAHDHNHDYRPLEVHPQGETFTMWWHFSVFTMC